MNKEVDLIAGMTSYTMERSLYEETTQEGYLFSTPYLVSGLTFAGIPEYLPCVKSTNFTWDDATFTWDDSTNFLADDDCLACVESSTNFTWGDDTTTNFTILDDDCLPCVTSTNFTVDDHCRRVNVCVLKDTTHEKLLRFVVPEGFIVPSLTLKDLYNNFKNGVCNVLVGEEFDLSPTVLKEYGYYGPYEQDNKFLSRELISMVAREDDSIFLDFANAILLSLMSSEEMRLGNVPVEAWYTDTTDILGEILNEENDTTTNIDDFAGTLYENDTSIPADDQSESSPIDDEKDIVVEYEKMFLNALAVVGDYGQLYTDHLERFVPRSRANEINVGNTAAMYPKDFGDLHSIDVPELENWLIREIKEKNYIYVGILDGAISYEIFDTENGYYDRRGFYVDFANAVAAALFDGSYLNHVEFIPVTASEGLDLLKSGVVDLLAGVTPLSMEPDVWGRVEDGHLHRFTFSSPVFHDSIRFVGTSVKSVECAETIQSSDGMTIDVECQDIKACVTDGTIQKEMLSQIFPQDMLIVKGTSNETLKSFVGDECQVFASGIVDRSEKSLRMFQDSGNDEMTTKSYVIGNHAFSRESFGLVTNENAGAFSKFVDLVINTILYADEKNITQSSSTDMPRVNLFRSWMTSSDDTMMTNIIQAVGNYQEIWDRNLGIPYGLKREDRNGKLSNSFPWDPMLMLTEQIWKSPPSNV